MRCKLSPAKLGAHPLGGESKRSADKSCLGWGDDAMILNRANPEGLRLTH